MTKLNRAALVGVAVLVTGAFGCATTKTVDETIAALARVLARTCRWLSSVFVTYPGTVTARAAMIAIEDEVRQLGIDRIGLHVFGHNRGAWALYDQLGYEVTNVNMAKTITRP